MGFRLLSTRVFGDALAALAGEHADTVMAARTPARQAVPTTFGARAAGRGETVHSEETS